MATIDTESKGGAWRREMLARALTTTELRQIVAELEHCLSQSRRREDDMRSQNGRLMTLLSESVGMEMELRGQLAALKRELAELRGGACSSN